jgi:hypothetical protein
MTAVNRRSTQEYFVFSYSTIDGPTTYEVRESQLPDHEFRGREESSTGFKLARALERMPPWHHSFSKSTSLLPKSRNTTSVPGEPASRISAKGPFLTSTEFLYPLVPTVKHCGRKFFLYTAELDGLQGERSIEKESSKLDLECAHSSSKATTLRP